MHTDADQIAERFLNTMHRSAALMGHSNWLHMDAQPYAGHSPLKDDIQKQLAIADDIVRSATVLAVAAIDDYFRTKFCSKFTDYFRRQKRLRRSTAKSMESLGLSYYKLACATKSKDPDSIIRRTIEQSLSRRSTQSLADINNLYKHLGLATLSADAGAKLPHNWKATYSEFVERRHQIVHRGDLDNTGEPNSIEGEDAMRALFLISDFVKHCDGIINNSIK